MSEPKRKKILIPTNQYQDLELLAKKHDLTVDQLVDQLLEKEIAESAKKEIFSPGLKWGHGVASHIFARVLPHDLPKLYKWLSQRDMLEVVPYDNDSGVLLLVNVSDAVRRDVHLGKAQALTESDT